MEELLNKLIEKGWKPFGEWCHRSPYKRVDIHKNYNKERTYILFYSNNHCHWKVLRQVVSKESWLWQFVCTNGLLSPSNCNWARIYKANISQEFIEDRDYRYRLIVSSLQDESGLEDFLIENIKV